MNRYKMIECLLCSENEECEYCNGTKILGGIELKKTYYTIVEGDTYRSIANLFYGKDQDYIYVMNANKEVPLIAGNKIYIPTTYQEKSKYA